MTAIRTVKRAYHQGKPKGTDEEVRKGTGIDDAETAVRRIRLTAMSRALRTDHKFLHSLMYLTKEWKRTAAEDCMWAHQHSNELKYLGSPAVEMKNWEMMARKNPKAWTKAVKEIKASEPSATKVGKEQGEQTQDMLSCSMCDKKFVTVAALRTHERNSHGKRHEVWAYACGSVCRGCGAGYGTRPRLAHHWKWSTQDSSKVGCFDLIKAYLQPLPQEEIKKLDEQESIQRREAKHQFKKPAVRLENCDLLPQFLPESSSQGGGQPRKRTDKGCGRAVKLRQTSVTDPVEGQNQATARVPEGDAAARANSNASRQAQQAGTNSKQAKRNKRSSKEDGV